LDKLQKRQILFGNKKEAIALKMATRLSKTHHLRNEKLPFANKVIGEFCLAQNHYLVFLKNTAFDVGATFVVARCGANLINAYFLRKRAKYNQKSVVLPRKFF
jgi:hypothetical protein